MYSNISLVAVLRCYTVGSYEQTDIRTSLRRARGLSPLLRQIWPSERSLPKDTSPMLFLPDVWSGAAESADAERSGRGQQQRRQHQQPRNENRPLPAPPFHEREAGGAASDGVGLYYDGVVVKRKATPAPVGRCLSSQFPSLSSQDVPPLRPSAPPPPDSLFPATGQRRRDSRGKEGRKEQRKDSRQQGKQKGPNTSTKGRAGIKFGQKT